MTHPRTWTLLLIFLGVPACVDDSEIGSKAANIIGGTETEIATLPYQVSVQYSLGHLCGGTIVTEKPCLAIVAVEFVWDVAPVDELFRPDIPLAV
jgi:hypothetical protein